MKRALLDVNLLVALFWPTHVAHALARDWFHSEACGLWASCPLTQAGFVRIVSNPVFTGSVVTMEEARRALGRNLADTGHEFWRDDLDLSSAFELVGAPIRGPRQVRDAYLLGLAIHHDGVRATLDRGLARLAGSRADRVLVIPG